jgi:ribosomal protein L11 methyltransferase
MKGTLKSSKYLDVCVAAPVDSGDLMGILPEEGLLGASEENGVTHLYYIGEAWNATTLEKLRVALVALDVVAPATGISIRALEDQDWNASWAQSVKPIFIGKRILIRQSWNPVEAPAGGIELVIDPKRAFGTGYHATTQLLAECLEHAVRSGDCVLDVGTGSGILAMVALRLGAGRALGIDNDPVAIECARENAALNRFGSELRLLTASIEDIGEEAFDVIVANLDRNTLLRYATALAKNLRAGGCLLVSGLQQADREDILAALVARGGVLRDQRAREEWIALELTFS